MPQKIDTTGFLVALKVGRTMKERWATADPNIIDLLQYVDMNPKGDKQPATMLLVRDEEQAKLVLSSAEKAMEAAKQEGKRVDTYTELIRQIQTDVLALEEKQEIEQQIEDEEPDLTETELPVRSDDNSESLDPFIQRIEVIEHIHVDGARMKLKERCGLRTTVWENGLWVLCVYELGVKIHDMWFVTGGGTSENEAMRSVAMRLAEMRKI